MNTPAASSIQSQMEKVESLITTAARLLAEGKRVDLAALEDRVHELCIDLKNTDPQTAKPFITPVGKLIDSLDNLQAELEAHQKNLEQGQQHLTRQKAHDAYQKDKK